MLVPTVALTAYGRSADPWLAIAAVEPFADQLSRFRVAVAQQGDELVAAPPRHDVRLAQNALERGGDETDRGVAARVAVDVVDPLQVVQIGEHQRRQTAAPACSRDLLIGEQREAASVVQPGQLVDERQRVQVALVAELCR